MKARRFLGCASLGVLVGGGLTVFFAHQAQGLEAERANVVTAETQLNVRLAKANARLDRALYRDNRLDRTLPFQELRRLAYLNDIANAAPATGFGDHIRRELERRRHER